MALQAGNRTYYNPTHGIEWRGNKLPYNTFYALLCLFMFFFMALIFKLCYTFYRQQIKKAEKKTILARINYERARAQALMRNGTGAGILKGELPPSQINDGDRAVEGTSPESKDTVKTVTFQERIEGSVEEKATGNTKKDNEDDINGTNERNFIFGNSSTYVHL